MIPEQTQQSCCYSTKRAKKREKIGSLPDWVFRFAAVAFIPLVPWPLRTATDVPVLSFESSRLTEPKIRRSVPTDEQRKRGTTFKMAVCVKQIFSSPLLLLLPFLSSFFAALRRRFRDWPLPTAAGTRLVTRNRAQTHPQSIRNARRRNPGETID